MNSEGIHESCNLNFAPLKGEAPFEPALALGSDSAAPSRITQFNLVVRFTNNVVVWADFWYRELDSPIKPGKERMPPCQDRGPLSVLSLMISCKRLSTPCPAEQ
jgi:hypothetical protein